MAYDASDVFGGMKIKALMLNSTGRISFLDANSYICSSVTTQLDIVATTIAMAGLITADSTITPTQNTGATANSNGIYETLTINGVVSNSVSGIRCLVTTDNSVARVPANIFGGNFAVRLKNVGDEVSGLLAGLQVGVDMGLSAMDNVWAYGINIDFTEISTRASDPKAFICFQDYDSDGSFACKTLFDIGGGGSRVSTVADADTAMFRTGGNAATNIVLKQGIQVLVNAAAYYIPLIAVGDWSDD